MKAYNPEGKTLKEVGRLTWGVLVDGWKGGVAVAEIGPGVSEAGTAVCNEDCTPPGSFTPGLAWAASIPMRPGSAIPRAKMIRWKDWRWLAGIAPTS